MQFPLLLVELQKHRKDRWMVNGTNWRRRSGVYTDDVTIWTLLLVISSMHTVDTSLHCILHHLSTVFYIIFPLYSTSSLYYSLLYITCYIH